MVDFGAWRGWSKNERRMDPEAFVSRHFARAAREVNAVLDSFRGHREMPRFFRQLAEVLGAFPPDDPPPPAVVAWLPGDGSPSPGGLRPFLRRVLIHTFRFP